MNKQAFIQELKATAKELAPLTRSSAVGALTWSGTEYTKSDRSESPNPYALSWQAMLVAIAELLEGQESPLTEKQKRYLNRLLFGGMGSFNDLVFDPSSAGDVAQAVNARLDRQRRALFASFRDE